ncbi:MAG: hypothetical protein EA406_07075 [Rhodospirillales bacterium]|nr:MAG: hypothetical protein EA406_07075 [Rhodospirillales bacterium]
MNAIDKDDMEDIDGCDVDFVDLGMTLDEALPAAVGGVMMSIEGPDADGCDVDFDELDATPDEALPVAEGGVA